MPDLGEFLIIGIVALLVIPPERLPGAARTIGQWIGRMQNYVAQMRTEIDREFHLADLRRIGEEARAGARSVESAIHGAVGSVKADLDQSRADVLAAITEHGWSSGGPPSPPTSFPRRYRPRPTIDDLGAEIERLKRELALPAGAAPGARQKYAPRARINRTRVRR
jgi:sec-independent protein translocase protein TatB